MKPAHPIVHKPDHGPVHHPCDSDISGRSRNLRNSRNPGLTVRPCPRVIPMLALLMTLTTLPGSAKDLIRDPGALEKLRRGVDQIYNYQFDEAEKTLDFLDMEYARHPVRPFFEGLISYWKYFPLIHEKEGAEDFEASMQLAWELADSLKDNGSLIEGVFFELMARSFVVMFHADNGHSTRAISHLGSIYRDIIKGFELQDEFKEFLFMTGLYNYYREAFPEAYPVYKPAAIFFRKGNKEEGLRMLRQATHETDFMKVEAALFLSLIHINFENSADSALWYASFLHNTYPGNGYFHSKYTEMLLVNRDYQKGLTEIRNLMVRGDYNRMKATIFMGMYEEKANRDPESAKSYYERGIEMANPYGERANYTRAYAYIGLSRYYQGKDEKKKAREFYNKARKSTGYNYVFK